METLSGGGCIEDCLSVCVERFVVLIVFSNSVVTFVSDGIIDVSFVDNVSKVGLIDSDGPYVL